MTMHVCVNLHVTVTVFCRMASSAEATVPAAQVCAQVRPAEERGAAMFFGVCVTVCCYSTGTLIETPVAAKQ